MRLRYGCVLGLGLLACGTEELGPPPVVGLGGGGTVSATGGGGGMGGEAPMVPGAPQPIVVDAWMVASTNASSDPVGAALDDGTFTLPAEGEYLGLLWSPVVPGEAGELSGSPFSDYIYAAAEITVPPGHRVFARGDTVSAFIVDNAHRYPGDFYASKKMRVPLGIGEGTHLVVVRALGRRGVPEVELWSTDAELVLNPADLTPPTPVQGSTEAQPLGIATLHLGESAAGVNATVVESDLWQPTTTAFPSLGPDVVTQLSFLLEPKGPIPETETLPVTLRVEGDDLAWSYEETIEIETRAPDQVRRVTRRSAVDGSTQYYAVNPPTDPGADGLILSLHGASVEAQGQAQAYSPKDWAFLVAPTNRRPYGFDWEEWGRLDALEALDHAIARYGVDPTRVHLTGHSMGGHGSWHLGVHFAHRFGMIGPSAGWISFATYGGGPHPTGVIGRARAASRTLDFVDNLAPRDVFVIHGTADDNVPLSQATQMVAAIDPIVSSLQFHQQPGAGHWWDADDMEPGADCVDWEPMIADMAGITVDPNPLEFTFSTPGTWVNAERSFVTLRSCQSPLADCGVTSNVTGNTVTLTTDNVRGLVVDGSVLSQAGLDTVNVDGQSQPVVDADIVFGPEDGKRPDLHGPLNQVFHLPFCFVWEDDGPRAYRDYAAWLTSWWSLIGNGHACGVPRSRVSEVAAEHNLVYLGVPSSELGALPFSWDGTTITVDGETITDGALAFVYPDGDRLAGYVAVTPGSEHLLFRYTPFSSRAGMPDFLAWGAGGLIATGFFDATWNLDPAFAEGL